ncbi:MAG: 1-acyl-sn-glycerol-3-phosphate acyltransferase [Candidatus Polarisedimenticolaceae bacterium]|nr:1-acyl-sn-glycerol-3-phosphate acyltransferase [Candidatus Polarisedimenticolaceae bacterium]
MNLFQIKMAIYATYLTNRYGLKLKKTDSSSEKKKIRFTYAKELLTALNITIEVKGEEKLAQEGPCLLISNHRSIIDPLVVEHVFKKSDTFGLWISKKELYDSFFFGLFTRNGGSILLDRDAKQMSGFFKDIKGHVKKGDSIFLFPEGTRNKEQTDLSEFKSGAQIIAMKNRLPILPVYIRTNSDEALKASLNNTSQPQSITIEIGDYIDYKDRSVGLEEAYRKMFNLKA